MKKVCFDFAFKSIEGVELKDNNEGDLTNAGRSLGNALAASTKGDAIKMWSLATRIHAGETLELDPSDVTLIVDFVKTNEGFTNLAKAQILEVLTKEDPIVGPKKVK